MDVDARIQLFDLKTTYRFETTPLISHYNMPLYSVQDETSTPTQSIASYPIYQGFSIPAYANGIQIPLYTDKQTFWNIWPSYIQSLPNTAYGDGTITTFQLDLPFFPAIPGYLDITGFNDVLNTSGFGSSTDPLFSNKFPLNSSGNINIRSPSFYPGVFITYQNANGSTTTVTDSGVFLSTGPNLDLYGLLMVPGQAPFGNLPLGSNIYGVGLNTVNYNTGVINVTLPTAPAPGQPIQTQCYFYQQGIPRAVLFYNNCLSFLPPPDTSYLIELDAYLTPAAFLQGQGGIQFAYMAEYIARGAARKILADTGDVEQFQFYEPLFKEQETLVWKRSQRQFTATRTGTIFSDLQGQNNYNNIGQGST
jgi:hypothetical protein